jgi:hypothetical protein
MMEDGIDRTNATYRDSCYRLVVIKRKYDPLLHLHEPEHQNGF